MKDLPHCQLTFPKINDFHEMYLKVAPPAGFYRGGVFQFHITVPPEYNNVVS